MIRASEFVLNFLLNAAWQITFIVLLASACAHLLSKAPARYRHLLWVVTLVISVALPLWSATRLSRPETKATNVEQLANQIASQNNVRGVAGPAQNNAVVTSSPTTTAPSASSWVKLLRTRSQQLTLKPTLLLSLSLVYALFLLFRLARIWRLWNRTATLKRLLVHSEIPSHIREISTRCAIAIGLKDVPTICKLETSAPGVVGGRAPVIILPESFLGDLPDETLCSVLGHEMAHIARRDFQLNLLFELLLLPISFHPLARFVKQQIDKTRELACDELVTDTLLEPVTHARSLVRIAGALINPADQALTLGIFDGNILEERIMKLTHKTRRFGLRVGRALTLTAVSFLVLSCFGISTFSFELRATRPAVALNNLEASRAEYFAPTSLTNNAAQDSVVNQTRSAAPTNETERMKSDDAQARAQAACDAGRNGTTDVIPQLISMLGDDRKTELIRCWDSGRWNPALLTFKQPSPGEQAAIALASMGPLAFEPLTNSLSSSDAAVRRNAAWAIGELTKMPPGARTDAVLPLISLLSDADAWVRMAAARALGELRDERAGQPLIAALLDNDSGVREISAWALGEMKDQRAVQTLCDLVVSDTQVEVRLNAAEALGEIRAAKAVPSLTQALNDADPRVRAEARRALLEIQDSDG